MNTRFAYRAMACFARELRAPSSVREYYARILRKIERAFPSECNPDALGKESNLERSRRASNERVKGVKGRIGR